MGIFVYEGSTEIDAPIDRVWQYLSTHDEWRKPFVESVRALTDGPMQVGSQYESVASMPGKTMPMINEITVHDPPRHLQWRQVNEDEMLVTTEGNYLLESIGENRTRFTLRNHYTSTIPGAGLLMRPMMRLFMQPKLFGQLRKGVAEMP